MKELPYYKFVNDMFSYVFSNTDLNDNDPEEGDAEKPGIIMTVESCNCPKSLWKKFNYEVIDDVNPSFRHFYRKTLRGEATPWKLTAIKISHRYMWMTFHNEELYRQYYDERTDDNSLPYYSENVVFTWNSKVGKYAKLCFELVYPNGDKEAIRVYFSAGEGTSITELGDNMERTILLPGHEVSIAGKNYQMISVTEHYR